MTRYIKFIERKYNPVCGCRTLRLGSIDQYRSFDATTGTGDPNEAHHGFRFGPGLVIDTGKDYFYESPLYKTGLVPVDPKVMRGSKNPAVIRGDYAPNPGSIIWPRENFFIYCLTALEDGEEPTWEMAQRIRPGADSAFEIDNIDKFVDEIIQILWPNLKPYHLDAEAMQKFSSVRGQLGEIRSLTSYGKVTYIDDLMPLIKTEEEFRKFSKEWDGNMSYCVFRKLRKFEEQREFRIAIMFDHHMAGRMPAANCWLDLLFKEMNSVSREIPLKRSRTQHRSRRLRKAS